MVGDIRPRMTLGEDSKNIKKETEKPMEINHILDRENAEREIKTILNAFNKDCNEIHFKKGIYIYGSPGCGKTEFVIQILKELDYDIIKYDTGDVRNKSLIDSITNNNISNCNVLQQMKGITKKIAIVMDEIDGMNNGDKGGITSLIKLIRQKKTKKQKLESKTRNPIICIGNYYIDKKIKELMKVCNIFELKTPTTAQMSRILDHYIPPVNMNPSLRKTILQYIQGDMRKCHFIKNLYNKKPELLTEETIQNIFHAKSFNEDAKKITQTLIEKPISIQNHNTFMNETDRTIVALLLHENIIDTLYKIDKKESFPFYLRVLDNMCFADYTDRITFQNQIWQFNEMSSLIKTFHIHKMYHDTFPENKQVYKTSEIRFTKVLTKYSTEYNNLLFIYDLCQKLDMDKKDVIAFFQELRLFFSKDFYHFPEVLNKVEKMFENYNINKLDIKRLYRYLDKNVKKELVVDEEEEEEIEEGEME